MDNRKKLLAAQRWVIKVGSSLLTDHGAAINGNMIKSLADQLSYLKIHGKEVVLVSSGAVAAGIVKLGLHKRPSALHELQAAAAVGQSDLIRVYDEAFSEMGLKIAQVLLGHDDITARDRYLNARGTLNTLLALGVIPLVNENDTVATEEIRFGDNDTLAALVANLVDADALLLLTDQEGLMSEDPRYSKSASLIEACDVFSSDLDGIAKDGGGFGRGGMKSKLSAARIASRSGTETIIADGRKKNIISKVAAGDNLGTLLSSGRKPESARKQWLASMIQIQGELTLDTGAIEVLQNSGKSLLPIGVIELTGEFGRGDLVSCIDKYGNEVARGLVNYDFSEVKKIIGLPSSDIQSTLGYGGENELIHRDNLILI